MKSIEELLAKKKQEIDNLTVPEEMESRLSQVLLNRTIKRRNMWRTKIAVMLLVVVFMGQHFNTLAFYSKRLMGYDHVMDGSLKQLNQLGKGQVIEESYTFQNGVSITLDGIMIDENQMLVFYRVKDSRGNIDSLSYQPQMKMKGAIKTYSMRNGQGMMNDDKTEIKWVMAFEEPMFYERKLTFKTQVAEGGTIEEGSVTFKIDWSKAMTYSLKKKIKETFEKDNIKIKLEAIVASPTRTVINGTIQNTLELVWDQIQGERIRPNYVSLKLVANNEEIAQRGGGMSTNLKGIKFHQEFDPLPKELHSLEIHLEGLSIDLDVAEEIEISKDTKDLPIQIKGKDIKIDDVYERDGSTFVTITSQEDILLTRVHLRIDEEIVELKDINTKKYDKLPNGDILHTRTLHFPANGKNFVLLVERISFVEKYKDVIQLPID